MLRVANSYAEEAWHNEQAVVPDERREEGARGGRSALVLWRGLRNKATPLRVKFGALLLALYVLNPIDLIPDTVPILGWIDDLVLIALVLPWLLGNISAPQRELPSKAALRSATTWRFWRARSAPSGS